MHARAMEVNEAPGARDGIPWDSTIKQGSFISLEKQHESKPSAENGKIAVEPTLECLKMNNSLGIKKPDTYVPGFLKYILLNLFKFSFFT